MEVLTSEQIVDIEIRAVKRYREWERRYVCQDINERHSLTWWIAQETACFMEGWQPIETIPDTGVVLVWVNDDWYLVSIRYHGDEKRLYDYRALVENGNYVRVTGATHWRPDLKGPNNDA